MIFIGTVGALVGTANAPQSLPLGKATAAAVIVAAALVIIVVVIAFVSRDKSVNAISQSAASLPAVDWRTWLVRDPVDAGAAWSAGDSWATSIAAVGAVLGTITSASTAIAPLIPSASD